MISENTLRSISHIFCGDEGDYYSYKQGYKLVAFFNKYFQSNDVYGQGFPSRWVYIYNKLVEFLNNGQFDKFLNIVLSREYIVQDLGLSQVKAAEHAQSIYEEFNRLVKQDMYLITYANNHYSLRAESSDLIYIDSGGFANVYKQQSTGHILKRLKDDFLTDRGIRSRFKREFEITKSLQDVYGIIEVYSFDGDNCSYTMEEAERNLEKYLKDSSITDEIRINCIRQILYIMTEVHKRDIIHRDLSPNNIFIIRGMLKIADFGLGKDLHVFTSHQTLHTNSVGQYAYCAPEQFMLLKDGDKQSDVYSLGRIINFIMTGDPMDSHHIFRSVSEKATHKDSGRRYADAGQLSFFFEKCLVYHKEEQNEKEVLGLIENCIFNEKVETYIYELNAEKISKFLIEQKGFSNVLLQFMQCSEEHADHIMQAIENTYQEVCGWSFTDYDPFASFSSKVLNGDFSYVVKEIAANILRYVAQSVNRFWVQNLIKDMIDNGIDPTLEDILVS